MATQLIERRLAALEAAGQKQNSSIKILFFASEETPERVATLEAEAEAIKAAGTDVCMVRFVKALPFTHTPTGIN